MTETQCYHCQLPIKGTPLFYAEVEGTQQPMCCPGCKAVTEAIIAGGLTRYYQHRTDSGKQAAAISERLREELLIYDQPDIQQDFVQQINNQSFQANLLIDGITCAACIWLLEKHVGSLPGVTTAHVNLSTHEAQVTWDTRQIKLSTIMLEITRIGYKALPWHADQQESLFQEENRRFIRRLAVAGIGAMQVMMYAIALYSGAISNDMSESYRDFIRTISMIVATPVVFYSALPFFKGALRDIRIKHPGMDVPVSLAIGGAYLASLWATYTGGNEVYFDSVCMFTFFLLTGRYLELKARHSTSRAARTLTHWLPTSCLKKNQDSWQRVPVNHLTNNDIARILPGDSIPADGIIISGNSTVDESMLTGEFMPVTRQKGQTVLGGSMNIDNAIDIRITHTGNQTRIAGIVKLLRRAQQEKPAIAHIADRVSGWFVSAVLLISTVVYSFWFHYAPGDAFWITLSVLVVTCPCALSLATPTALTAATGHLHKLGFMITRSHVLEGLNQVNHIIFDKTGTLTRGKLNLAETRPVPGCKDSTEALLAIASALEAHSEHPIAKAFDNVPGARLQAHNVKSHIGQGIEGLVNNRLYRIGKPDFASGQCSPPDNRQWLLLASDNTPLCWFRISDSLKPEAKETIRQLMATGKKVTLLSGDRSTVVASTAKTLGINHWQGEASPDDKLAFIRHCQQQGDRVLMIGDGINDIPVLAGADISLAMGNASDLARTSADAILISQNLQQLPDAFRLTQQTLRVIHQNLTWALAYNLTALPLAASGMIAPWMAALGMTLSSLIVVANALRLDRPRLKAGSKQQSTPLDYQET